ncbi:MAG: CsbD family protein [Bacteroidota bacterium]
MAIFSDKVRGNWNVIKGKLKQRYGDLSDSDLMYEQGKEEEMLGRLQRKTGESRQSLRNFIDSCV